MPGQLAYGSVTQHTFRVAGFLAQCRASSLGDVLTVFQKTPLGLYFLRLSAFLIIIGAVIHKNHAGSRGE